MATVRPSPATPRVHWHEGGAGPVLLLLNGWAASGLLWPSDWLRRLERRFHVVRVDNRGTGWSRGADAPFTIADMAEDAADVLRALGADRATVLGLSMGGMIAQELGLRHPGRVDRLVVVASRPPAPEHVDADPWLLPQVLSRPARGEPPGGLLPAAVVGVLRARVRAVPPRARRRAGRPDPGATDAALGGAEPTPRHRGVERSRPAPLPRPRRWSSTARPTR
ncbi:MAG: alpha/beta hydrolase [Acidimicrobiia bacterium]|nr:alpha/beta hydrolase [Acidimicrobiia bacterium]